MILKDLNDKQKQLFRSVEQVVFDKEYKALTNKHINQVLGLIINKLRRADKYEKKNRKN